MAGHFADTHLEARRGADRLVLKFIEAIAIRLHQLARHLGFGLHPAGRAGIAPLIADGLEHRQHKYMNNGTVCPLPRLAGSEFAGQSFEIDDRLRPNVVYGINHE